MLLTGVLQPPRRVGHPRGLTGEGSVYIPVNALGGSGIPAEWPVGSRYLSSKMRQNPTRLLHALFGGCGRRKPSPGSRYLCFKVELCREMQALRC